MWPLFGIESMSRTSAKLVAALTVSPSHVVPRAEMFSCPSLHLLSVHLLLVEGWCRESPSSHVQL